MTLNQQTPQERYEDRDGVEWWRCPGGMFQGRWQTCQMFKNERGHHLTIEMLRDTHGPLTVAAS